MTRPELGTKRQCGECGAKFYDLAKTPILCPKCGTEFEVVSASPRRESARAAPVAAAAEPEPAAAAADPAEVDVISLDEVEAEEVADVTVEDEEIAVVDDDDVDDDDAFLAEDEDDDDDVSGLLGGGLAGEDEEV